MTAHAKRCAVRGGVVSLALALSGCGGSGDAKPLVVVSSSAPAASISPSEKDKGERDAAEKDAVLASYSSMWAEQMKAYRSASAKGTDLPKYAALNALSKFEVDLARMKKAGTRGTGASALGHDAEVTALDTVGKLPKATLTDCIDLARWKVVRTGSGKPLPLPTDQPERYVATATAEKWEGRWMVTDYMPDGAQTC